MTYPDRKLTVDCLLTRGPILVQVDAGAEGVDLPDHVQSNFEFVVLRLGYGLSPAIPDLEVTDNGITATLMFGTLAHCCVLPWGAVLRAVREAEHGAVLDGVIWIQPKAPRRAQPATTPEQPVEPGRRGHLKLVN